LVAASEYACRVDDRLLLGRPPHPPHRIGQVVLLLEELEEQLERVSRVHTVLVLAPASPWSSGVSRQAWNDRNCTVVMSSGSSDRPCSVSHAPSARTDRQYDFTVCGDLPVDLRWISQIARSRPSGPDSG